MQCAGDARGQNALAMTDTASLTPAEVASLMREVDRKIAEKDHRESLSLTTATVRAGDASPLEPEFVRIPDLARVFGIKRGLAYALINSGRVKSVVLRRPGAKTGVRLVHLASVRDYLRSQLHTSPAS